MGLEGEVRKRQAVWRSRGLGRVTAGWLNQGCHCTLQCPCPRPCCNPVATTCLLGI